MLGKLRAKGKDLRADDRELGCEHRFEERRWHGCCFVT